MDWIGGRPERPAGVDNTVQGASVMETLDRSHDEDVICNLFGGAIPATADVVYVVDYDLWWIPWRRFREYYEFIGRYADQQWEWSPTSRTTDEMKRHVDSLLPID
jgi:hypothetical protein